MERNGTKRIRVRRTSEGCEGSGEKRLDRVSEKERRGKRGTRRSGKESNARRGRWWWWRWWWGWIGWSGVGVSRDPGRETRVSESRSRGQRRLEWERVGGERGFHEARGAPVDGSTAGRAYRSSCLIVCALLSLHLSTCRRRRLEGERAPTLAAYPTPQDFLLLPSSCRIGASTGSEAPLVPAFVALPLPWAYFFPPLPRFGE